MFSYKETVDWHVHVRNARAVKVQCAVLFSLVKLSSEKFDHNLYRCISGIDTLG